MSNSYHHGSSIVKVIGREELPCRYKYWRLHATSGVGTFDVSEYCCTQVPGNIFLDKDEMVNQQNNPCLVNFRKTYSWALVLVDTLLFPSGFLIFFYELNYQSPSGSS